MPGAGGTQRVLAHGSAPPPPCRSFWRARASIPRARSRRASSTKSFRPRSFSPRPSAGSRTAARACSPGTSRTSRFRAAGPTATRRTPNFIVGNALLRKRTFGNYPGAEYIMRAVYEGLMVPIDRGPAHRGALCHPSHGPALGAQHDPLAVSVHAGLEQARRTSGGRSAVRGEEARRAGRGHDGRRHHLCLGARRHRRRAARHDPGACRKRQGPFGVAARQADRARPPDARGAATRFSRA